MKCKYCNNEAVGSCKQCGSFHCVSHGKSFLARIYCTNCYGFVSKITTALIVVAVLVLGALLSVLLSQFAH